jgi:putative porin
VKNIVLATAVAAVLLSLASEQAGAQSRAASRSDLEAVQAQLQALTERLNRLEAANTELKTENAELKALVDRRDAETDYLKAQTKELREEAAVASNEIGKVKGADWATKVKWRGDLRYRHEQIMRERTVSSDGVTTVEDAEDRYRHRIRARFGLDAQVSDHVKTTVQLTTAENKDPRSSNQSLDDNATRKEVDIDLAYVDWTFAQGADLIFGKQPYPFYRTGSSLFFDGDLNPEGIAAKFERGILFGTGYGWWWNELHNDNPSANSTDTFIFGGQLGVRVPVLDQSNLVAFAHYYNCSGCRGESPIFNNNANGNTTFQNPIDPTNLLLFDYEIGELGVEFNTQVGNLPLQLWGQYAQNMASDVEEDTAYNVGFRLGRASNPKTWEVGAMYQSIDKDALFGQLIDSDFGNGVTDTEGWALRGAYAPVRNIAVNLTYFINTLNKDVGTELDYDRLQLDLNWRY